MADDIQKGNFYVNQSVIVQMNIFPELYGNYLITS
jgi:hypothetical protein